MQRGWTWIGLVAVMVVGSGCASVGTARAVATGQLALTVALTAVPGEEVEVFINAVDMESPIASELEVEGLQASGTVVDVDAGEGRHVLITTRDQQGRRCSITVEADIWPERTTSVTAAPMHCSGDLEELSSARLPRVGG